MYVYISLVSILLTILLLIGGAVLVGQVGPKPPRGKTNMFLWFLHMDKIQMKKPS